jgi:uracil-DNA glycosylase family 4
MPRILKPDTCSSCIGYRWTKDGYGFSRDEGHGLNGVLIVGEALGRMEAHDGLPFRPYAESGSLLERAFRICGWSRDQFRLTNCLRCQPPADWLAGAPWEFGALRHCRPNLDQSIAEMKPRCIFALGGIALRELTGMAGYKQGITYLRGFPLLLSDGTYRGKLPIPVVASFHPSFLRHGKMSYFSVLLHDLQRAVAIARTGVPEPMPTKHRPMPSLDEALSFKNWVRQNRGVRWLVYDIETPTSADADEDERDEDTSSVITQIQFSVDSGEGIVFPGTSEYLEIAREIMSTPDIPKAGHYVHLFDDPRLHANGFRFDETWDTYEMWHHMQPDLPANLQFVGSFYGADVPWKHLAGTDMGAYGCWDVDVPQRILAKLPADLKARGLWDGYLERVHRVRPILDLMSARGIPMNKARLDHFGEEIGAQMEIEYGEMQALVPEECRDIHPKQGYKRDPKDTTGLVQRKFLDALYKTEDGAPDPDYYLRWCRIEPFTPSPKQLVRYMKHRGHPVPRDLKKGKDTTAAKELERLYKKTGDILYMRVIQYRELQKMKGTYVVGWQPSIDGRVHSTFTFAPATGQLSSRNPNVQNGPQHEKEGRETGLADKFNRCQEAPDGYTFVSFDHKSFHALTLAYLAQDPDYERIVRADVHSFLASQFLKLRSAESILALPDDELLDYLKWVKKHHREVRDGKAKRCVLGWGFGMGYRKLYQTYQESFSGESEAKRMIETLESLFPKTVRYRLKVRHEADKSHHLQSPFSFRRWFWDVIDWRPPKSGSRSRCLYCGQAHGWGDQSEEAIAYLPANLAFGMMRDEARAMRRAGYDDRFGLINNIHDAWYFCCPDALVDECVATIKPLMEAPSPILVDSAHPLGLSCATSVSMGRNLAKRSESNPHGKDDYIAQPATA